MLTGPLLPHPRCLFGWAGEKVAGGVCVGHRVGVAHVEDQGKVERAGTGGQGLPVPAKTYQLYGIPAG